MVTVPIYEIGDDGSKNESTTEVPVLDIHEVLDYLHAEVGLQCPAEVCKQYWDHMRGCDMPHAKSFPGSDAHVPFSLYGDECVLGDPKDKITGIFVSLTLFKPKAARQSQFLVFCMQDANIIHENLRTLEPILRHIVYTSNIAFHGVYPRTDMYGAPLTPQKLAKAGRCFSDSRQYACVELRGDWKWHERVLRLKCTPVSRTCCFLCDAQSDDSHLRYYSIGENASWRSTEVTTAGFIANKLRPGTLSHLHAPGVRDSRYDGIKPHDPRPLDSPQRI